MATKRVNRSKSGNIILLIFILTVSAIMLIPLIYAISSSLKPMSEFWLFPPTMFPANPTFDNYKNLFSAMTDTWVPFSRYVFNTCLITFGGTAGHIILSSMCAYSICKLKFPGHQVVFKTIVLSLMFNASVASVPCFLIINALGLVDTYWAYILPAWASPMGLYLMKQFMETTVPDSLLEAARIDGASNTRIFFRIVMPLSKSAWLTLILFSFQGLWNTGGNAAIQSEELKTINYAISQITSSGLARAGASAAATVIMMILPILVFIITQSNVIETMATSGMKD